MLIDIAAIHDPSWNSRLYTDARETKELAQSMKARAESGRSPLINPVVVARIPDSTEFELVTGSRRLAAAKLLNLPTIEATIETYANDEERLIDNIVENTNRVDLSTYEEARACAHLRDKGLTLKQVREKTGLSESQVSVLVSCFTLLPDPIKQRWAKQDPIATLDFLRSLLALKDPDKQVERWKQQEAARALVESEDEDDEDEDEEKAEEKKAAKRKVKRVLGIKPDHYESVIRAIKKIKPDVIDRPMILEAFAFLIGDLPYAKIRSKPLSEALHPLNNHQPTATKGK